MPGFVDIHNHLIYGLDDGPKSFEEMAEMLRAAQADGIDTVIATPHVYPGIRPFDNDAFDERVKQANAYCKSEGIALKVYRGAEVLYTPQLGKMLWENRVPKMRDTDCVLVEFVPDEKIETIENALGSVSRNGGIPIIAHVERLRCLVWHTRKFLEFKKSYEALLQINCSCVLMKKDILLTKTMRKLLSEERIDFMATDAHNTTSRRPRMTPAYKAICEKYGKNYADKLTGRVNAGE